MQQVLECINMDKIQEISREYFENDPSVRAMMKYLYSPSFTAAWEIFISSPEVDDILEWMGNRGVNVESEIKLFSEEVKRISPMHMKYQMRQGFSIKYYEEELKSQIDFKKLSETIDKLFKDGNDFTHLYLILSVTKPAIEKIFDEPEIREVVDKLEKIGIDLGSMKTFIYQMFRFD